MMMITLLVLSATGVTLYNKSPDKKITSGVIPFKKDEASSQLALTDLPLFKKKKMYCLMNGRSDPIRCRMVF